MKYLIICITSFFIFSSSLFAGQGEAGSKVDSFKVKAKLELKNKTGAWRTIYSGTEYLETIGTGAGTIAGTIDIIKPAHAQYTDIRTTALGMQIKAKVVIGGITYYTTTQSKASQEVWAMSTDIANYGVVTITTTFPSETHLPTEKMFLPQVT